MKVTRVREPAEEETEKMPKCSAELIKNVQFIYELALAELELEAFGLNFSVTHSLRRFILRNPLGVDTMVRRLAYFKTVGHRITDYYRLTRYNRTRSVNQYLTHWIYPYKGKFHPQMIRALLNILKLDANETVLDPFIGSGTTAVEAQLPGINCIGIDVSPLCVLQSKVKTESIYVVDEIKRLREESLNAKPHISSERAALMTEFYKNGITERVSVPLGRALAFRYLMKKKKLNLYLKL